MEWTHEDNTWKSDSYVIELTEPGRWIMRRREVDDAGLSLVEPETEWAGGSLKAMKALAESLEQRRDRLSHLRRNLVLLAVSAFVIIWMAGMAGRAAAVLTLVAAGVAIYSLTRVVDALRSGTSDKLREIYQ